MPASWPIELPPQPERGGYAEGRAANALQTSMDKGPPKSRRVSTAGVVPVTMNFILTQAQTLIFDTFYDETLQDGTLTFIFTHPRLLTSRTWKFDTDNKPELISFGAAFQVSCNLLLFPE